VLKTLPCLAAIFLESVNTIALNYKIWYDNCMEITKEQFDRIASYLPRQRGLGHTVYVRMNRWSKSGVLQHLFKALQIDDIIKIKLEYKKN